MTTAEAIKTAYAHLNIRRNILAPASNATVEFPAFNPCRACQAIAIVSWPATVHTALSIKDVVLKYVIRDGDSH